MLRSTHYPVEFASIYLQACQNTSEAKRAAIRARMRQIAQEVSETGDNRLLEAYTRHARLLSLVLDDPEIDAGIAHPAMLGPISAEGRPGVSIVTCSMNRTENLLRSLSSWLAQDQVSEVVIVDWSSDEPVRGALRSNGIFDQRIKIIRVNGINRWILSYAFNTGFRVASFDSILKLDADIVLQSDFFQRNAVPTSDYFIAGNWRHVPKKQAHVNGFFFSPRAALASVGGFNEFITTYGWDDDDIYARFQASGFQRRDVAAGTIHHLPHSDAERIGDHAGSMLSARDEILASPRFMIQRNRLLAERMPTWTNQMELFPLQIDARQADGVTLSPAGETSNIVADDLFETVTEEMLRELMVWDYGPEVQQVPKPAFDRVMSFPLSQLSKTAFIQAVVNQPHPQPCIAPSRRRLFIDAQHGLGNRLRAIGSAAAIADASDCELVIVWQPDDHCDCRFSDLFAYDGAVIDQSLFKDSAAFDVHNYMPIEGGQKDAPIRTSGTKDIYVRSAFVLNSPHSDWQRENRFIQTLRAVDAVQALVNSVRSPNDISAHVRMEGGTKDEHLPYEGTSNWTPADHELIDHWRMKSHFRHFIERIDTLIAAGRAESIFLAADQPATYAAFTNRYGKRLAYLQRNVYDRSSDQLRYALADAILLSRSQLLLGSTWSSFSELALRLAAVGIRHEMSGKDF
jgi:GT2 family glycosyltransferase